MAAGATGYGGGQFVVVGGGVIGCAIAYELARAGERVTLLERGPLAREASYASAGIISSPSPRVGAFGLASFHRYPALIAEVEDTAGMRVGWNRLGETQVLLAGDDPRALQDLMEWQGAQGLHVEWLEGAALRAREPALAPEITAAIWERDAGSVRVHLLAQALARAAVAHGALVREYTPVRRIVMEGERAVGVETADGVIAADCVVVAAGAWSRELGDLLGVSVPTMPVHGQMYSVTEPPVPLRSVVAGGGGYLVPRADGTVAVGATTDDFGYAKRVTPDGIGWLTDLVHRIAPSLAAARLVETWSGLRPGSADGQPIIGPVPERPGVWAATGHYRGGALYAAATGEYVSRALRTGTADPILAPFSPARFGSSGERGANDAA